jgi:hypothetical protein
MAIHGQGSYMGFGFQPQGFGNPFVMRGVGGGMACAGGVPMGMMGSPFGFQGGNPMQQMMQMMMGALMGMMAGQMMAQMMQGGAMNQPFGQFTPVMNPCFGGGGVGGGGGNGVGNFLGCGCQGFHGNRGTNGAQGSFGGNSNGAQGPNTMTPPSSTGSINQLSSNRDERIQQVVDAAKRTYPDKPHLAKLAAAQALLESGIASQRGPSGLARNHNNLFGIKGSGTAGSVNMRTGEHFNGRDVTINANFAKNATVEDSFQQHKNLMNRPRYRGVVQAQSFEQAAQEVKRAGYATAPNYSGQLVSVYNQHLARYF